MRASTGLFLLAAAITNLSSVSAGPLIYGLCQSACNAGAVTCYAAAGYTFGTVPYVGAPAVIIGCNVILGTCMAACTPVIVAPTP